MNQKLWVFIFRLEILIIGILFCGISVFAVQLRIDENASWGFRRILLLGIGICLIFVGFYLSKLFRMPFSSKSEKYFRYFIKVPNWCLLSLLLMEIVIRIFISNPPLQYERTNIIGTVPVAGSELLWGNEGYAITNYLRWGEIRTPFQSSEANNIVVLGDSFTEGLQVADSQKYPSVTEIKLNTDGFRFDIHNMGRSGFAMADYISWIPVYINIFHPKIIVIQIEQIDFVESFHQDKFNYFLLNNGEITGISHKYKMTTEIIESLNISFSLTPQIIKYGRERLSLILEAIGFSKGKKAGEEVSFNSDLANQQLKMLIDISDGLPIIFVFLPDTPKISGNDFLKTDTSGYKQLMDLLINFPQITVVDPTLEFQQLLSMGNFPRGFLNSKEPGIGHLNKFGNEIVGELLADAIEERFK